MSKELTVVKKTEKQSVALVEKAQSFKIATVQDQFLAEDLLKSGKALKKSIDEHYDSFLDPLKLQIKEKEAERKGIVGKIDEAITLLKDKLTNWLVAEKARKVAEAAAQDALDLLQMKKEKAQLVKKLVKEGKVEEAQEVANENLPVLYNVVETTETTDGINTTSRLTYEIENVDKIPDFFFKPRELDTKKIWKAGYAGQKVPGIKFFRKDILSVKI